MMNGQIVLVVLVVADVLLSGVAQTMMMMMVSVEEHVLRLSQLGCARVRWEGEEDA